MVDQPNVVKKKNPFATELIQAAAQVTKQISSLAIELVSVESLKSNPKNAKQHPDSQIRLLAENYRMFGVTAPAVIDENNMIIAGHARFAAARLLNLELFPTIRLKHLTAQQKRAVALADNKLAELGTWNFEILSSELKELTASASELNFDYSIIGFDTVEIDQLLGGDVSLDKPDPADEAPAPTLDESPVTKTGDLWICGQHRFYCGNALDFSTYQPLLRGEVAQIVFTDPPYNVPNAGHVSKRVEVREFAMAAGELTSEEFVDFLRTACGRIADYVADGSVIYICMDWRHLEELSVATRHFFGKPKNMVVWVKTNGGQGTFYRSQHEHIVVYVAGKKSPTNNFKLGERGRYRTNVWRYPGSNTFSRDRDSILKAHPTVKPVALVVDALRDCSKRGDVVLDPFGGSGTTMIAAERTGRVARLIEIDPIYCDVILRRWQTLTGKHAHLAESNETFAQADSRRS